MGILTGNTLYLVKLLTIAGMLFTGTVIADTQQEINHLLEFVSNTTCQYERNCSFYDGVRAEQHIKKKYEYFKDRIHSAEDFIKYSATKSTISGNQYKIHCADMAVQNSSDWLLDELKKYRDSDS